MASKFLPGMKNVLEVLNQMWDAFAAGPYNAVPLSGGTMTGPLSAPALVGTATGTLVEQEVLKLNVSSVIGGISGPSRTVIKMGFLFDGYGTRIVAGSDPSASYAGYTSFETGIGQSKYLERMRITERGSLLVGTTTDNAVDLMQVGGSGGFTPAGAQGTALLRAGLSGAVETMVLRAGSGALLPAAASVMYIGQNTTTGSSIRALGNFNTPGNDYAEYIVKSAMCGTIAKGQLIGITQDNTVTDKWADAVMFAIKSTAPSFVGGDTWATSLGPRPEAQAGPAPLPPARRPELIDGDLVTPGDTDAEWAAKQAAYAAALAAHDTAVQLDTEAMAAFDAALEVERQKVDRIAIAGRVPVNVLGTQPGDYIVPVQDGDGIKGIPVRQADLGHLQYLQAVGRVISIEPDGRAYVMVKVV